MSPEDLALFAQECEEEGIDDPLDVVGTVEVSWVGRLLEVVLASVCGVGPLYLHARSAGREMSWHTPLGGGELLRVAGGVALYLFVRSPLRKLFLRNTGIGRKGRPPR